jgi:hypothetical protein
MANCIGVWQKEKMLDHKKGESLGYMKFTEFAKDGPKNINVQTVLTRLGTWNNNCSASVSIDSFVTGGQSFPGNGASVLYINNCTEVNIRVDLAEGYVTAAAMVFVWA